MPRSSRHILSATNHLARGWDSVMPSKMIHLVFESCRSNWSSCLENAKLLLVEYLWVSKALVTNLAEVLRPHDLLTHHQVILLWPVDSFLALDVSYAVLRVVHASNCAYWSDASWHVLLSKLFNGPWSVGILGWDLGTVTLEPYHSSTDAHNSILISWSIIKVLTRGILLTIIEILLSLVSKSPAHHWLHPVRNIAVHNNIVFFDNCYATRVLVTVLLILHLASLVILLSLYDVTTQHLWVLNLDLRVVEDVVVIIDVLYYFDWLLPVALLLRLRWTCPSLMRSWEIAMPRVIPRAVPQHVILGGEVIRVWSRISRGALMSLVTHQVPISIVYVVAPLLLLLGMASLVLLRWSAFIIIAFALLINNFFRVIYVIELNTFLDKVFRGSLTVLIKVQLLWLWFCFIFLSLLWWFFFINWYILWLLINGILRFGTLFSSAWSTIINLDCIFTWFSLLLEFV